MKILYGIQGTGNGHISRASAMAEAFADYPNIEITWLLSGRKKEKGCGAIKQFLWREGLTFIARQGKVSVLATILSNNIFRFIKDILMLDLEPYDIIVTDYEPVVALAAKIKGKKVIGIGHQYAFDYCVPKAHGGPIADFLMKYFAPVNTSIGLHWSQYGAPILPPIIDLPNPEKMPDVTENKVVVYLPFENLKVVKAALKGIAAFDFYIYHPDCKANDIDHLHFREISREGFKHDLFTCKKVIVNSGFELISECLQLGKEILTKPLQGQVEQHSNAKALKELGYAYVVSVLEESTIRPWLEKSNKSVKIKFPNVSKALAGWLATGCTQPLPAISNELWAEALKERNDN